MLHLKVRDQAHFPKEIYSLGGCSGGEDYANGPETHFLALRHCTTSRLIPVAPALSLVLPGAVGEMQMTKERRTYMKPVLRIKWLAGGRKRPGVSP